MCKYIYKGKTYTYEELFDYVSNTKDSLVDLDINTVKGIAEGIIPESIKTISNRSYDRLKANIDKQIKSLRLRLENFEKAQDRKGYVPKEDTVNRIKDLQDTLNHTEDLNKFFEIAKYVDNELNIIHNFLEGEHNGKRYFDMSKEEHMRALIEIEHQLNTYKELATALPEYQQYNDDIKSTANRIDIMFKDIVESIDEKKAAYMENFLDYNTKEQLSKDDIKSFLKESKDISFQELYLSGMSNSMDKLLQLIQKHVETTRQEVYDNTDKHLEDISKQANKLRSLGVKDFNWMLQKDDKGKLNGNFITKVNGLYYKVRNEMFNLLKEDDGKTKRQFIVKADNELTDSEKKHNLDLGADKRIVSNFFKAELNIDGQITDGEYHKYTDEFKNDRNIFEEFKFNPETKRKEWLKKPYIDGLVINGKEVSENDYNRLYKLYQRKYYTEPKLTYVLKNKYDKVKNTYYKDGTVTQIEVRHVKPEYVEVITNKDGKQTKFADKDYYKLMSDNSELGKVKREYYQFYVNKANELLSKLPLSEQKLMKNKLFRVRGNLSKDVTEKGFGFMKVVTNGIRKFINPDVIFSSRKMTEDGDLIEDVPIFFTGEFKDNKQIERLTNLIEIASNELKKSPSNPELVKKLAKLKNSLLIEQNKMTVDDLELDLNKSLSKAAYMAENYDLMKKAETTLLVARNLIKDKKFYKTNAAGEKEYIKEGQSNVEKRFETYLRMIFYSTSEANNSKVSKVLQNLNQFTAFKTLGLNPFSSINNFIMANINNRIEGFGKQYGYSNKHLNESFKITNAYVTSGAWLDKFKNKDPYDTKPKNKFEAMIKHFNWFEKDHSDVNKGSFVNDILFSGITAGEFLAQSKTAIAKLLATEITDTKGNKSNLWDVYEFKDGKLQIKEGYELNNNDKRKLTIDIKNMNKVIHGNYSENDKSALQEHALGQTALQFKKWMFNFAKNRFGNTYFDESAGQYMEGRYRTMWNLINFIKAGSMNDLLKVGAWKNAISNLDDYQRSNLKKLQAESIVWMSSVMLYYLFDALAEGIDDEDEELKWVVNFLKRQSDRVSGEIDAMINPKSVYSSLKNPFASLTTTKEFGDVLVETTRLPFLYAIGKSEDAYYDKGPNKGKLKLAKELNDVIPVLNLSNQFDAIMNSGNYYFR